MCLYPESNIQKAETDIIVYKIFDKNDGELISPYRRTVWKLKETKKLGSFGDDEDPVRRFRARVPKNELNYMTIGRGLHAFTSKTRAKARKWRHDQIVARCVIPAGTPYILGVGDEIASLALRPEKVVY